MAPIRGWGPKGERLVGFAPHGRWHTLTFLAALRINALTAPCVVDGPINGVIFRAYVEQFLVPTLRPGDIVILDNLGSHRSEADSRIDPRCRRQARVPAALLARPQSHRAGLRQGQALAAHGTSALHRRHPRPHRKARRGHLADECANYLRNAGYASI